MTFFPNNWCRKAARTSATAFISSMLMCFMLSSSDQTPEAVSSRRCTPQPDRDLSVYQNRDGGGTCRRTLDHHLSSRRHHHTASMHSCDRWIWLAGSSRIGDQWSLSHPWEESSPATPCSPADAATSMLGVTEAEGKPSPPLKIEHNKLVMGRPSRETCRSASPNTEDE